MPEGSSAPVALLGPVFGSHWGWLSGEPQSGIAAVCVAVPVVGSNEKRRRKVDCGTQSVLPSGENRGPSAATE